MLLLAIIAVLAALFYYKCIKPLNYWKERGVPHSPTVWFFGHSLPIVILRKMHRQTFLHSEWQKYRDSRYFGLYTFLTPMLVIKDPKLIKQIVVNDFDHFAEHSPIFALANNDEIWKHNVLSLSGQKWRDNRAMLSPSFTTNRNKLLFLQTIECSRNFINFFKGKGGKIVEVDIVDAAKRFTNDSIAINAFGVKVNSLVDRENDFYMAGKAATAFDAGQGINMLLAFIAPKLTNILQLKFFPPKMTEFFQNLVQETIKIREEKNVVRPDVIQLMMETKNNTDKKSVELSNSVITSHAFLYFFGGFDTVSSVLTFTLYELAMNPDIQDKLRQEILEVKETQQEQEPSYEKVMAMKYMDMVLSESMRKWPPMTEIDRKSTKPYVIEPVRPGEKRLIIETGTNLSIPLYSLHHDPEFFPDPEKFDPERFNEENKKNINSYAYIPFGYGPRVCMGAKFATMELKTMLFYILSTFEVVPLKETLTEIVIDPKQIGVKPDKKLVLGFKPIQTY